MADEKSEGAKNSRKLEIEDIELSEKDLDSVAGGGGPNESIIPEDDYTGGGSIKKTDIGGIDPKLRK